MIFIDEAIDAAFEPFLLTGIGAALIVAAAITVALIYWWSK